MAPDVRRVQRPGRADAGTDASTASVADCDRPHGGDARLDALARAHRIEDRLATREWYAVEGDLLGGGPGTGSCARALALCALRHRVAAQWSGPAEAHRQ